MRRLLAVAVLAAVSGCGELPVKRARPTRARRPAPTAKAAPKAAPEKKRPAAVAPRKITAEASRRVLLILATGFQRGEYWTTYLAFRAVGYDVDVAAPENFDPARPLNTWRGQRTEFFSQWIKFIHETRSY